MAQETQMSPEVWLFLAALTLATDPGFDPMEEHGENLRELLQRAAPVAKA